MAIAQNIWEKYGFVGNPFDTGPLSFQENSLFPIEEAFVGRSMNSQESRLLTNILRNPGGARFVVDGEVGVGKTSFVNYHRHIWENHSNDRLLSTLKEISISASWELRHFLWNILAMVITKLASSLDGKAMLDKSEILKEIQTFTQVFWQMNRSFQAQILGVGGGWGQEKNLHIPELPETQLLHYLHCMVQEIHRLGYAGLLLHFDNLDVLGRRDVERMKIFMDDIRDVLQIPYLYSIFVAHTQFFSEIILPLERVRSIFFGRPVRVPPLSKEEVLEAVTRRYEILRISSRPYIKPVSDKFVLYLYDLYQGRIRFIMDTIYTMLHYAPDEARTIEESFACKLLEQVVMEKIKEILTLKEWEILQIAATMEKFTNQEISRLTKVSPSNISNYLRRFQDMKYVIELEQKGKRRIYQVASDVKLIAKNNSISSIPFSLSNIEKRRLQLLEILKEKESITCGEYQAMLNISASTAVRDLRTLVQDQKLLKSGKSRAASYRLKGEEECH